MDICEAVRDELLADPRVEADDIEVKMFSGDVLLNGTDTQPGSVFAGDSRRASGGRRDYGP